MTEATEQTSLNLGDSERSSRKDLSSTFVENLSIPVHRWFRYSAGFSAEWVAGLIESQKREEGRTQVLDPFAGSGTVPLVGEMLGVDAIGVEAHPFVARVARAKLLWDTSPMDFGAWASEMIEYARAFDGPSHDYPDLIHKCFPKDALAALDALRQAWESKADESSSSELSWLALTSILRACSPVGTAKWQYVLPNKSKSDVAAPFEAFREKVELMREDMRRQQRLDREGDARYYEADARDLDPIPTDWADLVITSPPYANNFDYADSTRLEMSFWGQVERWKDLQDAVRKYLIPSCTQHARKLPEEPDELLGASVLGPIRDDLTKACERLAEEKQDRGGRKPYDHMAAAYFRDMGKTFQALRRATQDGASLCYVVGDSAPYGVHLPVETWLGELAVGAGFESYSFEKTRDRNVKWDNRVHKVPLHEGRLWIKG